MNPTPQRRTGDEELFAQLRELWSEADPVPTGLVETMIAAVASEDLDLEYELLTVVTRADELAGARSPATESVERLTSTLEFSSGQMTVLLRISGRAGARRIDGWVTPAEPVTVRLAVQRWDGDPEELVVEVTDGRFSFPSVPHGLVRVWLTVPEASKPFATPLFEI